MASSSLTSTHLAFNNGVNYVTMTATSDGLLTYTANAGDVRLAGLAAPTSANEATTKGYVDSLVAGLQWKEQVQAATTAAGTLATSFAAGQVIDGVTLVAGDRILIKDQASAVENGIYVVTVGAPTRSTDMAAGSSASGVAVFVEDGTVNADVAFVVTTDAPNDVVGTDPITWVAFSSGGIIAGTNLTKVGNTINFPGIVDTTLTLASGSITDTTGTIDFDNENLQTTGIMTATSFTASSDKRLKTDVVEISEPLDRLAAIRGVTFKWKHNEEEDVGVIAQEIQAVCPHAVHVGKTGFLTVDYGRLAPLLIESVKALVARVEELEAAIKK